MMSLFHFRPPLKTKETSETTPRQQIPQSAKNEIANTTIKEQFNDKIPPPFVGEPGAASVGSESPYEDEEEEEILGSDDDEQEDPKDYKKGKTKKGCNSLCWLAGRSVCQAVGMAGRWRLDSLRF